MNVKTGLKMLVGAVFIAGLSGLVIKIIFGDQTGDDEWRYFHACGRRFPAAIGMLIFGGVFCAAVYFSSRAFAKPSGVKKVMAGAHKKTFRVYQRGL